MAAKKKTGQREIKFELPEAMVSELEKRGYHPRLMWYQTGSGEHMTAGEILNPDPVPDLPV